MTAESHKSDRCNARKAEPRWQKKLENDPHFLQRIAKARKSLRAGRGVRLENVK
jgi:hypothetical protein